MYKIIIRHEAKKKLQKLPVSIRTRIVGAIYMLEINPDDKRLDIKKLHGESGFRLRVGTWRVIYERDDEIKLISIEKVGSRGDVYK